MKLELVIFGITGFLITNTYYDGKYTKMLQMGQKYFKMIMFGFIGLSLYIFIKKHPNESKGMLSHANDIIRYMPIDKNTTDLISPIFDLTTMQQRFSKQTPQTAQTPQTKRMLRSGKNTVGRSVGETKKKYIASRQNWRCAHCNSQLDASFQVDHVIRLADGGTNHIDNLEALCCNCHGKKTTQENMK